MATRDTRIAPPRALERFLLLLLPTRDRDTVAGDLHEAYIDRLSQNGLRRADLWYAWQVLSFLPRHVGTSPASGAVLASMCSFTALAGLWLGGMDLLLRHPGFDAREVVAGTIVTQALLTLLALRLRADIWPRIAPLLGCVPILMLAAKALREALRNPGHIEGYILLIALALVLQATLTLLTLGRRPVPPASPLKPL